MAYNCASASKDALKRIGRKWAGLGTTEQEDALKRIGRRWAGLATTEQETLGTRRESEAGPGKGKLAGGDELRDEISHLGYRL